MLVTAFEGDWAGPPHRFAPVAATAEVLALAAGCCREDGLRAYDAVQLASALAAREATGDCDHFLCFDDDLRVAAGSRGFFILD